MSNVSVLIEIGVEEFPASYIPSILSDLSIALDQTLCKHRLNSPMFSIQTMGTPRRLVLFLEEIFPQQESLQQMIWGPVLSCVQNSQGQWNNTAKHFAKKNAVPLDQIQVKKNVKKEKRVCIEKTMPCQTAQNILQEELPLIIKKMRTPKSMRFIPHNSFRFARPIRWIVALIDKEIISFEVEGIRSGRKSFGHFFATNNIPFDIPSANLSLYQKKMSELKVIVDEKKRTQIIQKLLKYEISLLSENPDYESILDEDLIQTVSYSLEWPDIVCGKFDPQFLKMPDIIIKTTMTKHLHYFPMTDCNRGLLPFFLNIINGMGSKNVIRWGNERVLKARLDDAYFFWKEDTRESLEEGYSSLKKMIYHQKIGSYFDKTESERQLAKNLIERYPSCFSQYCKLIDRTIMLSKIDLTSKTVFEFPELQGKMGAEQAKLYGENPMIVEALKYQYIFDINKKPLSHMLTLVSNWDNLINAFRAKLKVTASSDPYKLRRSALLIIQTIYANKWSLEITGEETKFILERLKVFAKKQLGIRKDIISAVSATLTDSLNVTHFLDRISAIQGHINNKNSFQDLLLLCGRVTNILQKARETYDWNESQMMNTIETKQICEKNLMQAINAIPSTKTNSTQFLTQLLKLKSPLESYFENILVLCDDKKKRLLHLSLLQKLENHFLPIAHFSLIEKNKKS